eukprot:TRINITY_DN1760_c0_g1_i14.p1 TRINITY_DN1760_c0_g1~~TRINITY_DN1760_c0_g1_i14.p1  ORF type:complete len:443 (+),score=38.43 TRINITY_DN1760_c0_g1_i14:548-1876(+)
MNNRNKFHTKFGSVHFFLCIFLKIFLFLKFDFFSPLFFPLMSFAGGFRPLMVSKGRDATELFESYHSLTDKPREILKKFAVPSKNLKNYKSMFNWDMKSEANAFAVELRGRVREYIKNNRIDTMAPWRIVFYCWGITFFTMWLTVKFYWTGAWWSILLVPTLWWISFIQTFHDATHFAFSKNEIHSSIWVYLYPYFSSPTTWDHQHVIGHHIFTNIFKKDPDLNHGMPAFRLHTRFTYRPWFRFQMLWVWFVWMVSTFYLSIVYDWTGLTTGMYHGVLPYQHLSRLRMAGHLFGRVMSVFLTCGIPFALFPFWQALSWSVSFYAVFGFCFMLVTQVNHIVEECVESAAEPNECWAIHQVKTSHNFSHGSWLWWMLSGGLNYQIEHHLFPGINSNHLPGLAPIVQELCQKYGIPYQYSPNYFSAVVRYLKVVAKGSEKNSKQD